MMSLAEEFCRYLKENDFQAFMNGWRKQYERLGRCGGKIKVTLNESNRELLGGLLGQNYRNQKTAVIDYAQLKKALYESRYAEVDFETVLSLYYGEKLISKQTMKAEREKRIQLFFERIQKQIEATIANEWFWVIKEQKGSVYQRIIQSFDEDEALCEASLMKVLGAVNALPLWKQEYEMLPVFASRMTGNPHAFDQGTFLNYLLYQAICYYCQLESEQADAFGRNAVYQQAGLMMDRINNYCSMARIRAVGANGEHPGWKGFYEVYEPLNVNIENLEQIESIDATSLKLVCIVENPSVFQLLLTYSKEHLLENVGFVCTNGQCNAAVDRLLDLLGKAKITMLYSGDMDPEGLLIAQRLKTRYGSLLTLWRYALADYQQSLAGIFVSDRRLTMLTHLKDPKLRVIGSQISKQGVGYQENLIDAYLCDLSKVNEWV